MIEKNIKEGLIGFKFLSNEDLALPFKDEAFSETFGLTLKAEVQYRSLVFSDGTKKTLFHRGDLRNISITISKRDLLEPVVLHSYSFEEKNEDGTIVYSSKFSQGSTATIREYPNTRDMCISVVDPRYYSNNPEYDIEILGYINQEDMLCYRTSRDDFQEEFIINKVPEGCRLAKIGLNDRFKFQFLLTRKGKYFHYV